jgi:hypothetical protein
MYAWWPQSSVVREKTGVGNENTDNGGEHAIPDSIYRDIGILTSKTICVGAETKCERPISNRQRK